MKAKIKKLWVKALRSGEYTQAKCKLRGDKNERCCLGVLCDVYRKVAHKGKWIVKGREKSPAFTANGEYSNGYLPEPVMKWAGLNSISGDAVFIDGGRVCLSGHNDNSKTFDQIATAIKEQL